MAGGARTPAAIRRRRAKAEPGQPLNSVPPEGSEVPLAPLIRRDAKERTLAFGLMQPWFGDLYHRILTIGWVGFFALGSLTYLAANALFACLYLLEPGAIANARPGAFSDAFFFSIQTMATIGYGQLAPATLYANLLVTVETAIGLIFVALSTGLVFARFSRPTARVLFSNVAVVGPHNGAPTLSLRVANRRRNQILQAQAALTLVRDERTHEGLMFRRFYDLRLARSHTPIFALTFTVMHEIDRDSPLYGATSDSLAAQNAELVVTATGVDETLVQTIHARTSYLPHQILWNHRFVDVIGSTDDGRRAIDYRRFHDTVPLTAPR